MRFWIEREGGGETSTAADEQEREREREKETSLFLFLSEKFFKFTSSSSTRERQAWAVASSMAEKEGERGGRGEAKKKSFFSDAKESKGRRKNVNLERVDVSLFMFCSPSHLSTSPLAAVESAQLESMRALTSLF